MRQEELTISEVTSLVEARRWAALREMLRDWPPPDIADLLTELPKRDRVLLFRSLERRRMAEIFSYLESADQDSLLRDLTDEEARHILATLPPDDRTTLLEELPGRVTQRMLNLLSPQDLKEARQLLGYPEESVGRLMTPDYVALRPEWTIERALAHIRARGRDSETINRVYIVDADWRLLDDIELRRIILADPSTTLEEIMDRTFVSVSAFADREEAVHLIQRFDVVALPVVDSTGVLLGIVTVDDLLDVAEQEATEDFHKIGSVDPITISLKEASIGHLYRRRIGWLFTLVFVNVLSGAGIAYYQDTIATTVALVFFLPLLIASAGNAGSQAATLIIRALATGDVKLRDWLAMARRELGVSLFMGLTMATGVFLLAFFRAPEIGLVVAAAMTMVVIVGSLIGLSLPFVFTRLGWDPATASAPLITSLADIFGVFIYLSLASWYLG